MDIKNTGFSSIEQITEQYLKNKTTHSSSNADNVSFEDILSSKVKEQDGISGLKFSKHASQRLMDRNINLSNEQMERLTKGAKLSGEKGIKESLVLMDDYAFIVNTQNSTVITAMEKEKGGDNVYTNIDGTVLV